nr:hypothetical protein [Acidiferrobacterales bacterium]
MLSLFLAILSIAVLVSVTNARNAVLAIFAIGFLQDPFRKLVPGEPIYFIVTVGIVFAAVFASIAQRESLRRLNEPFVGWTNSLREPLSLFFLVLALQFLHSFIRYGNPIISAIGLLSYTAPFFAIVVGYFLVVRAQNIRSFMLLYAAIGLVLAFTVLLSFSGVDYRVFKEVGAGLIIYDQGTILRSFSGFMRTGEIAAWHLAAACCFLITLFFSAKKRAPAALTVAIIILLMGAIALTGRRKMLMLVTLFAFAYGLGFAYYRRQLSLQYVLPAFFAVFCVWLAVQYFGANAGGVGDYIARSTSVYGSATTRALELGVRPIGWAIERVGLFGGGLGIASQGSHLFSVSSIAGGSGEGGLGKIMVELGLPGLIAVVWLAIGFAKYIDTSIRL